MANVYTRTGDQGDTGLFGGSRVAKQSQRVEAYGTLDEGNAALGLAKAGLPVGEWRDRVHQVQQRLFVVAAELASDATGAAVLANTISADDVAALERLIDDCLAITGPQREFVVPGRDETSAAFHVARTIIRRAERCVLTLAERESVRPEIIMYLNRLSDAVYALARLTETWHDLAMVEDVVRAAVRRALAEDGGRPTPVSLDLASAKLLADAAEAKAVALGVAIVFAAVDAAGNLMLVHRMPDALLASTDIAINKAWTAVAFKASTGALGSLATGSGPLAGLGDTNGGRVVLFGGGEPVIREGRLQGGLGVSGGTVDQDEGILNHAIATVMGDL